MNDKERVSDEVFDGERLSSDINVCTDKHDLEAKMRHFVINQLVFDICAGSLESLGFISECAGTSMGKKMQL